MPERHGGATRGRTGEPPTGEDNQDGQGDPARQPEAGLARYETERAPTKKFEYDPRLDPQLVWAGKVQCIYVDPPYGINYNSNFQARIDDRSPKETDDGSLTREPEQIQAYRDTWTLAVGWSSTFGTDLDVDRYRHLRAECAERGVELLDEILVDGHRWRSLREVDLSCGP